ncbi:bifunctional [glutamate--ammonia ligase]-adenylyl-L-tyrosine phosphorylase/[glutamate--ammonia-ligase] adenylyltransferase [Altericroceibacterium endophyticum]|uniref:Bifunctional [glutamate--ammonia ligase]-adenylyl-L-tyrosine phosphorylase/[glutamate--ammonia-ligase] adenylyltransferase n=1 Tax=Altericroceibacterium endophyticum TaxID=1808508 RepID=A0A6I4T539_9SPHN|nr:bifunctional [glutamate--ammonia ligase]-adenylyl-L-tyrosine phosphorylase/[glutamate--ammonia-ligase] adenylyltransferase [Altericroceibacterium endophyticum]MXO65798.1 bifunctional [glutamate--ammonia ligase]-adenylyl-L-tyrosine phosphorylase/[glutamate--ammonia-ligase] adenylyltransferase [Altericroceibacterium endophyticum]
MQADWSFALKRARSHAPFLSRGLDRLPQLAELLAAGNGDAALDFAHHAGEGIEDVGAALRREKLALSVSLAIGDLAGAFPLAQVMEQLSAFADRALDRAITAGITHRVPDAEPAGFSAIALGKHGARELNYSSDIDPILLYDPDTLPRRERDEPGEAAQRVARRLMELLTRQTGDGYVFRVDLRLRPASEVSPLAISYDGALTHYESSALAWERAAFIRSRASAGSIAEAQEFLDTIRPFIWRRNLDFTAIEEIRQLTQRIRDSHEGARRPGPGYDVKKGRGGIREIEFFAQTHQLIHGGRNRDLRLRGTRAALDALAAADIIAAEDAAMLGESYDRLRVIEHRLQMVEDRQTHELPQDAGAIDNVAQLDGLKDGAALIAELEEITGAVAARYDQLLDNDGSAGDSSSAAGQARNESVAEMLARHDLPDAERLAERIANWPDMIRALRSGAAREAFHAIRPALIESLAQAPDPQRAFARWESLLSRLPSAINLFRLFEARPGLLDQVLRVLILAPPLADELARRPELLDALIDASALDLPEDVETLRKRMLRSEKGDDYERKLDRIRQVVGEERFALGVQLIESRHDPLDIAAGLSRVAEAALKAGASVAEAEFAQAHGRVEGDELLVLGLGRLGGGSLTHASDLDLIYLFDGEFGVESDGRRPLTASLYFNRLAQRVTAALSVPTAQGALYEVDTRLRPQGAQGPIAVSVESFARYQREDAWTWEHMALTRARPVAGSSEACTRLQEEICAILQAPRDHETLRADVLKMRADVAAHKQPSGPLDMKMLRGGLVDCEFLIHYLQLREGIGLHPDMADAITALAKADLVPPVLLDHYQTLARSLIASRLLAPDGQVPTKTAQDVLASACGSADFDTLLQKLGKARQGVAEIWTDIFDETLEIEL